MVQWSECWQLTEGQWFNGQSTGSSREGRWFNGQSTGSSREGRWFSGQSAGSLNQPGFDSHTFTSDAEFLLNSLMSSQNTINAHTHTHTHTQ